MGYERQCFEDIKDDGSDVLTLDLHTGDHDIRLELNEEQRQLMAGEGWTMFMDFAVPMYRDKTDQPK